MTAQCVSSAAREFKLPLELVYGMLMTEGGKVGMFRRNTNGTVDHGPMQINTVWLKTFGDFGVTQKRLAWDGCLNVRVGSWILKKHIIQSGGNIWKGVAKYHSKTPSLGRKYQYKVYDNVRQIYRNEDVIHSTIARANRGTGKEYLAWR